MITSSSLVLHRLLRSPTMHITKPTVQFSTELEWGSDMWRIVTAPPPLPNYSKLVLQMWILQHLLFGSMMTNTIVTKSWSLQMFSPKKPALQTRLHIFFGGGSYPLRPSPQICGGLCFQMQMRSSLRWSRYYGLCILHSCLLNIFRLWCIQMVVILCLLMTDCSFLSNKFTEKFTSSPSGCWHSSRGIFARAHLFEDSILAGYAIFASPGPWPPCFQHRAISAALASMDELEENDDWVCWKHGESSEQSFVPTDSFCGTCKHAWCAP